MDQVNFSAYKLIKFLIYLETDFIYTVDNNVV